MFDSCGQRASRKAHRLPVVLVGGSAGKADLVMAAMAIDAGPRETVSAGLSKKVSQKIHDVHQLDEEIQNTGEVVGKVSVKDAGHVFKLRRGTGEAVTEMHPAGGSACPERTFGAACQICS